jgi:hypothetical protein
VYYLKLLLAQQDGTRQKKLKITFWQWPVMAFCFAVLFKFPVFFGSHQAVKYAAKGLIYFHPKYKKKYDYPEKD